MVHGFAIFAVITTGILCAAADARAGGGDDHYEGSEQPQLPRRGELKSIRGLHKYIRARIPDRTAPGVVDGMSVPLTRTKKHDRMNFLKFDTHKAVSVDDFRDAVKRRESDIL